MARIADGKSALIEAKAVDGAYPLVGTVKTDPEMTLTALFARDGDVFGAAADPSLLARLQLKVGDRISVGNAMVEIRAVLLGEPDKLGGGIGFWTSRSSKRRSIAGERSHPTRKPGALALPAALACG